MEWTKLEKNTTLIFDVSTLDKIVCSELIYITFGNVKWPTEYRLGRPTITPDDVAEILFEKNTKFQIKKFMVSKELYIFIPAICEAPRLKINSLLIK